MHVQAGFETVIPASERPQTHAVHTSTDWNYVSLLETLTAEVRQRKYAAVQKVKYTCT
jgi:hypothetical protein